MIESGSIISFIFIPQTVLIPILIPLASLEGDKTYYIATS